MPRQFPLRRSALPRARTARRNPYQRFKDPAAVWLGAFQALATETMTWDEPAADGLLEAV